MNIDRIDPLAFQKIPYLGLANFGLMGVSLIVPGKRFIEPPEEVVRHSIQSEGFQFRALEARFFEELLPLGLIPFRGDPVEKSIKSDQALMGNRFETNPDIVLPIR